MYTEEIVKDMIRTSGPYKGMVVLVMIKNGKEVYTPMPPNKAVVLLNTHKNWLLDWSPPQTKERILNYVI